MRKIGLAVLLMTAIVGFTKIPHANVHAATADIPAIEYKSAIIVKRYKLKNGHVYVRKYNKTTKKWIGDWHLK